MADDNKGLDDFKDYGGKIGKAFFDQFMTNFDASSILGQIDQIEKGATEVAKSFGQGREQITAIKGALADAVESVTVLGGGWNDILEIQKGVTAEINRNLILSSDSYDKLYATKEVTGRGIGELTKGFKDAGFAISQIDDQMQKVVDISRANGVNASAVSKQVVDNMSSMNQFNFQGGVEGMAKMAAQAVSLRVDMKSVLDIANNLFDPEKAIEMASAMQRLGVAQGDLLDPLRLMDLAQNDPAELQNQIAEMSEQFVQLNKDGHFEIMPGAKRQLMEIESAMGLPRGQLSKMALGAAEVEDKMSKIKFPDVSEDQKKMIANMAEMGESGQYEVTFTDNKGQQQTKAVTELQKEDIDALAKASEPKDLEKIQSDQLTTQVFIGKQVEAIANRTGRAIGKGKAVTTMQDASREIAAQIPKIPGESFTTKGIGKSFDEGFDNFFKKLDEGGPLSAVLDSFQGTAEFMKKGFDESLVNAKTSFDELNKSTNPVIQSMMKLGGVLGEFIKDKEHLGGSSETTQTVTAQDFMIKTLPEDKLVMAGGTNLDGGKTGSMETKTTADINLNIKIDSNNPNIKTEDIIIALNEQSVKEKMLESFRDGLNSANGSNGSNPITARQQMNRMANMA
jgi:hypothetical protein